MSACSVLAVFALLSVASAQTDSVSGYAIKMATAVRENEVKVSPECVRMFLEYSDGLGRGEHWALKSKHLFKLCEHLPWTTSLRNCVCVIKFIAEISGEKNLLNIWVVFVVKGKLSLNLEAVHKDYF